LERINQQALQFLEKSRAEEAMKAGQQSKLLQQLANRVKQYKTMNLQKAAVLTALNLD
jgi:hypothetical protein